MLEKIAKVFHAVSDTYLSRIKPLNFPRFHFISKNMEQSRSLVKRTRSILIISIVILLGALLTGIYVSQLSQDDQSFALSSPITHQPTYLGNPSYILGSGNIFQNGTAYS